MGIDADGVVSVDEFVHHALISAHPPGAATQEAIALRIRELDDVVNLSALVREWMEVDDGCQGIIQIQEFERRRGGVGGSGARSARRQHLFNKLDAHGDGNVSYAEFCASKLGLEYTEVYLHFYDLSYSVAKYFAHMLPGQGLRGVWHT